MEHPSEDGIGLQFNLTFLEQLRPVQTEWEHARHPAADPLQHRTHLLHASTVREAPVAQ
jgi:hypothetical protein